MWSTAGLHTHSAIQGFGYEADTVYEALMPKRAGFPCCRGGSVL